MLSLDRASDIQITLLDRFNCTYISYTVLTPLVYSVSWFAKKWYNTSPCIHYVIIIFIDWILIIGRCLWAIHDDKFKFRSKFFCNDSLAKFLPIKLPDSFVFWGEDKSVQCRIHKLNKHCPVEKIYGNNKVPFIWVPSSNDEIVK